MPKRATTRNIQAALGGCPALTTDRQADLALAIAGGDWDGAKLLASTLSGAERDVAAICCLFSPHPDAFSVVLPHLSSSDLNALLLRALDVIVMPPPKALAELLNGTSVEACAQALAQSLCDGSSNYWVPLAPFAVRCQPCFDHANGLLFAISAWIEHLNTKKYHYADDLEGATLAVIPLLDHLRAQDHRALLLTHSKGLGFGSGLFDSPLMIAAWEANELELAVQKDNPAPPPATHKM